ncbi:coproporphyrinogen III oxidase, partial [bacterium]|nr:coproporphyrinogen III oxidase [bacterium]
MVKPIIYKNLQHLYIHWPFCPYKCHFCDFVAIASHEEFMQSYHDALIQEVRTFCTGYTDTTPLKTIYVGGGTPSTWPPELLSAFFAELRLRFTWEKDIEITLEVNPGTVT